MAVPLDLGTEFRARAVRRLREDMTAWLTSTDREGTPQPAPVWFLWNDDDSSALVYSQPSARRLSRIQASPRGSLHLNDTGQGHDFVVHRAIDPSAAPGRLEDATGLPPAYVEVGQLDIFRDEDIRYALTLSRAGVPVELHLHPGVPHEYDAIAFDADVSRRAHSDRDRVLRSL